MITPFLYRCPKVCGRPYFLSDQAPRRPEATSETRWACRLSLQSATRRDPPGWLVLARFLSHDFRRTAAESVKANWNRKRVTGELTHLYMRKSGLSLYKKWEDLDILVNTPQVSENVPKSKSKIPFLKIRSNLPTSHIVRVRTVLSRSWITCLWQPLILTAWLGNRRAAARTRHPRPTQPSSVAVPTNSATNKAL